METLPVAVFARQFYLEPANVSGVSWQAWQQVADLTSLHLLHLILHYAYHAVGFGHRFP